MNNPSARKAPSFKGLKPASATSSRAKSRNKRRDTEHEILLRSTLWRMGLRFRKNVETMTGKPDIVFSRARVVVFCDGDFWHGRGWNEQRKKLSKGTNAEYWVAKIKANMQRDQRNNALLENQGWRVVRLWERDIKQDPAAAAKHVKSTVEKEMKKTQVTTQ